MSAIKGGDQIIGDDMAAASYIYDRGTFRHFCENLGVQNAFGFRREGQKTNRNFAACEEIIKAIGTCENFAPCIRLRRAGSGGNIKIHAQKNIDNRF